MTTQTDLIEQSPLLTPLTILPKSEMHQHSSSVSRFDTANISNALSSVAERLPRSQTYTPTEGVTGGKLNEGFKNLTRNFRRDFSLRGFGRDSKEARDSRDNSTTRDSSAERKGTS
jgi:hypothetical protein